MKYLVDTCVISELAKPAPDPHVLLWMAGCSEENLYLSVITFGELHKGIAKLAPSRRRDALHQWVEYELRERFGKRVLTITLPVVKIWGEIMGLAETRGYPMPAIDSLIAATGLAHDLIVATRNVTDMQDSGVSLYNPWEEDPQT